MGFSVFTDLITPTKYRIPDAPNVNIDQELLDTAKGNAASFSAAKGLATDYNDFMRAEVAKSLSSIPGYADLSSTLAKNLAAQLRGELTASDAAATQRSSAAAALGLGIAGSPAGAAFTARNLGLRQYEVQQRAQAATPGYLGAMKNITGAPMFDFSNVFLTPAQRISVSQWNKVNAYNRQSLKNQMDVQPEPWMKSLAGFGDSILDTVASYYTGGMGGPGGSGGGAKKQTNPWGPGGDASNYYSMKDPVGYGAGSYGGSFNDFGGEL